jgi:hypothetical protein
MPTHKGNIMQQTQATILQTAIPRAVLQATAKVTPIKEETPLVNIRRRIYDELKAQGENGQGTAKEMSEHLTNFGYKPGTVSAVVSEMFTNGILVKVGILRPAVYALAKGAVQPDDSPVKTINRISKKEKERIEKEEKAAQRRLARAQSKPIIPPSTPTKPEPTSTLESMDKTQLAELSSALDSGLYSFEKGPAGETPEQRDKRIVNKVLDSITYRQALLLVKMAEELRNK